jgi:polysaccharide biosynthesis protein PslG
MAQLSTQQLRIQRQKRQVRGFVVAWSLITLLVGLATFAAIYLAYDLFNQGGRPPGAMRNVAIAPSTEDANSVISTNTPFPTRQLTREATQAPTDPAAVAQAATNAPTDMPQPTLLPIEVTRFELGTQVQVPPDLNPELMAQWANVASQQLSLNWVKQQVRWEDIEETEGELLWAATDLYLPAMAEAGVKVLVSVVTTPDWAREPGVNLEQHGPPADYQDYVDFVVALLERYPGMIHAVEVWNEHNLDREWTSARGLSAANYIEMLRLTYTAIKDIDPGIIVVSGALSPTGLSDGVRAWDDFVYLDQMIAAGLLNYSDCIGVHHNGINVSPEYRWDATPNDPTARFRGPFDNPHHSWSFRSTLEQYASKVQLAGGDQPLCITEFGWASTEGFEQVESFTGTVRGGFEFALDNTLEEQRDFTLLALDFMRESGDVRLAFLWNLNYGPQAGWDPNNDNVFYSIIGPGFQFRPVFDAVRDWNREYEESVAP